MLTRCLQSRCSPACVLRKTLIVLSPQDDTIFLWGERMGNQSRTAYKNNHIKEHYDRINLTIPKGQKERIRAVVDGMGISVNEYIWTLICRDTAAGNSALNLQRGLTPEQHEQLDKWQVAVKYREMIDSMHVEEKNGMDKVYTITLKDGYINDFSGSRVLVVTKMQEVRKYIKCSHKRA